MARKPYAPQPLPAHYDRITLDTPVPIKFRNKKAIDSEGRGNNWTKGSLHGWDRHVLPEPCPITWSKVGGWRTLNPENYEWQI